MIFVVSQYPIFALLVWNQNDTRVGEEANFIRVYNFFTNPSNAMNNITFLFGYVSVELIFCLKLGGLSMFSRHYCVVTFSEWADTKPF